MEENKINEEMTVEVTDDEVIIEEWEPQETETNGKLNIGAVAIAGLAIGGIAIGVAKTVKWVKKRKEAKDMRSTDNEEFEELKNVIHLQTDADAQEIVPTEETDEEGEK